MLTLGKVKFTKVFIEVTQHCLRAEGEEKMRQGKQGGISAHFYVMCPIAAMKVAVYLVDMIDDNVSENHCISTCSSTKAVSSSNLSQHILTMTVD